MTGARVSLLLLALLVPLVHAGCSRARAGAGAPAICQGITVSSTEETGGAPADTFSATRSIDLTFTAAFRGDFAGDHLLELLVLTPRGHLYRSLVTPITSDTSRKTMMRPVVGYPHPMPEQVLHPRRNAPTGTIGVDLPFPVAGTDIVSAGLYGTWRVEARLDGGRTLCKVGTSFTLTE
jgi:hypothetical protein